MRADERLRTRSYLFWILARRDYSRFQLERKLKVRGISVEDSKSLLDELIEEGLYREQAFTEARIRSFVRKGLGRRAIEAKLKSERCPFSRSDIDRAFEELGVNERDEVGELVAKTLEKFSKKSGLDERKLKSKVVAALSRKGHPVGAILEAYRKHSKK